MQLPYADIKPARIHRVDAQFLPRACPRKGCPSHSGEPFRFQRKGTFSRKVDLRSVQRFRCLTCSRGFSSQTFRVDYRIHHPWLPLCVFQGLVSKTSLRQTARNLGCKLDTVLHHLALLGMHCAEVHAAFLARLVLRGGWSEGTFQLDELETFEIDRRLFPLTVPVLIHKKTRFVVATDTGTLPARGNLSEHDRRRRDDYEALLGKRVSQSKPATKRCFEALRDVLAPEAVFAVQTDEKSTYPPLLRKVFGRAIPHQWVNSRVRRDRNNLLFPINNVLAQARDNLGRLVRRNWGHSKRERNLRWHLAVWALYRNYVRERSHFHKRMSSAQAALVAHARVPARDILEWRGAIPRAA